MKFQRNVLCGKNIGTKRRIIEDTSGCNATLQIAKRKIDFIGNIKSHSWLPNKKENLAKLKNKFELFDSIACIQEKEKNDKLLKSASADNEMIAHLPKACDRLKEFKNDLKRLTKKDICCILLVLFKVNMKESLHNKSQFVSELESKIQPLLVSNTNWIDKEKIKFMVSVNVSASQGNQKK